MSYKRKLFYHITLAMIAIFILISTLNIYFVISTIDNTMQKKVLEASSNILKIYTPNSKEKNNLNSISSDYIKHLNFHYFKIEDKNQTILFEQESEQYKNIISNIKEYNHNLKIHDDKHIEIFFMHDHDEKNYYIKIQMTSSNNNFQNTISGLYDANEISQNIYKKLIYDTVELLIMFILILSAVYPTILLLNRGFIEKTNKLSKSNIEILKTLGSAIAKRDSDTNSHNYRVTIYSIILAEAINYPKKDFSSLIRGAFLHDIGKIGISDSILLKKGKLTAEEFTVMKTHTSLGKDIITNNSLLHDALDIVESHHEKYDGSGYPKHLKGEKIPLSARIFSIADVFDALTSKRPYKEPFSYEEAKTIMINDSGTHFDPKLLDTFFEIISDYYDKLKDSEDEFLIHMLDAKISIYYDKE